MAYSKAQMGWVAKEPALWPDLRYSPDGRQKLFNSAEEVPDGWTTKPPIILNLQPTVTLDRDELVNVLTSRGVSIDPTWGNGHMKRIIDGDVSPTG